MSVLLKIIRKGWNLRVRNDERKKEEKRLVLKIYL